MVTNDEMKRKEFIKDNAWIVEDLLTKDDCHNFLEIAIDLGILNQVSKGDSRHWNSSICKWFARAARLWYCLYG